jgi:hypothetical protein
MDDYKDLSKSELYGCEHLLRLFCRLPPILADDYGEDDDTSKPILAKLNDLAWFLQNNQSTLCCQLHCKKNEDNNDKNKTLPNNKNEKGIFTWAANNK